MKNKLRVHPAIINASSSFPSNGFAIIGNRNVRRNFNWSVQEDLMLSEFDIDSETMEEHQEELLLFMMHHDSVSK